MNLSTVKWAQWDKNHSRELLGPFICVCIALCTIIAHNIARNRPDNFPSYPPDHCSDDVYLREGVWNLEMLEIAEVAFTVTHGHCYGVLFSRLHIIMPLPSVLWHCWLGGRKGIRPVKIEWWGSGVGICLWRSADLHMAQLMPLLPTVSCFSKIQIGFTFLVPAHPGSPG